MDWIGLKWNCLFLEKGRFECFSNKIGVSSVLHVLWLIGHALEIDWLTWQPLTLAWNTVCEVVKRFSMNNESQCKALCRYGTSNVDWHNFIIYGHPISIRHIRRNSIHSSTAMRKMCVNKCVWFGSECLVICLCHAIYFLDLLKMRNQTLIFLFLESQTRFQMFKMNIMEFK